MGCCEADQTPPRTPGTNGITLAIAGNPNCGKSALFNSFTGIRQKTGNWPGVTVERKEGRMELDGLDVHVIDLPGIYSLDARSLDERVTRDYLLSRQADLIVNLVDASNLERNLYFTVQLLEMGVPLVLALNMMDVARRRGIRIDAEQLSRLLGCPVVPVVAVTGEGLTELKARILGVGLGREAGGAELAQSDLVEQAVSDLRGRFPDLLDPANRRWLALKLLERDDHAQALAGEETQAQAEHWRRQIQDRCGDEVDLHLADHRFGHAHTLAQAVERRQGKLGRTLSDRIDQAVLSRTWGIPIFLAVMYLMFMFSINVGGAFVDLFDGVGAALFVDGFGELLTALGTPDWLVLVLAKGIGGGLQVVGTFIPIIACLYLFLSILEDSGYMARAAFVMDRFMHAIGLPGKAFVPLIVGFGCNVPAVMATRTLENERERKLTILMNPFMSCGARLPVYALFAAAFFPTNGQNLVFGLYLTGITVAILTGLIMKRTLLPGESSGFIMELPPYHLPTPKGLALRTWDRVKLFVTEAGRVILAMVLVLNLLNSIGTDGSFGNENSETSLLSTVGKAVTPAFAPLGIQQDNWPATVGIFTGVLAKETVVGTLNALYGNLAGGGAAADAKPEFNLWEALGTALATVPENLGQIGKRLLDPLGLSIDTETATAGAADAVTQAAPGLFGAMAARFDGQVGAFAYLLLILLYFPCAATIGAIVRETGGAWATFVAAWTSGVAYAAATLFYQIATFERHPASSGAWILGLTLALAVVIVGLRLWAGRDDRGTPPLLNTTAEVKA